MVLESKALQINLEATAVDQLEYAPRYKVLREAVKDYQGVLKAADHLLFELHHPYRNWPVVIGELRAFALKNLATYSRSNRGVESIAVIITTFLDIIDEAPKKEHKVQAVEGLMAFLEKLVQTLEPEILSDLEKTLTGTFQKLYTGSDSVIEALITSFHPFPRLVRNLAGKLDDCSGSSRLWQVSGDLMKRLRKATMRYWLSQPGPVKWLDRTLEQYGSRLEISDLDRIKELLAPVSHSRFEQYMEEIGTLKTRESGFHTVRDLLEMPGHLDIVRNYRQIAHAIGNLSCNISASAEKGDSHTPYEIDLQLLFLFHLLEIDGLAGIHEEILRQINRSLVCKVRTAEINQLKTVLPKSFDLLKQHIGHFPRTALQCIETLGNEIFRRSNQGLMELFLDQVINFGFQTPGIRGVDSEWHILSNPAHLQNIRVWLNIIGHKPKVCSNLLSALLVYLRLGGTCIRDTDLFQKDVTRLLNCDIGPVYNMVKQLAKILPVYFNEIGAEGLLRDVSTELDEISHRKDILIHFLRKQSHVESNNLIVDFIQAIFCFWYSRQKDRLKPFLPPEILGQIPAHGPYVEHVHRLIRHLAVTLGLEPFARHIKQILNISDEHLALILDQVSDVPPHEKKRLKLLIRMFRLETLKYELGTQEIRHHLEEAQNYGFHGLDEVIEAIERDDPEECLNVILEKLEELKKIILSPDKFEIHESIYHKRHIAADIPSMYGRYHEKKFDALSLTYRLENLANVYFERLSASLDVPFITKAIFVRIVKCLRLFWRAIQLNEVHSKKFATYLTLLEKSLDLRRFTFSQYLDIVRGLSDGVKDMIYVYYIGPHQDNLERIIKRMTREELLPKYHASVQNSETSTDMVHKISENFMRDLIASTFGLQYLDNFIARVYQVLAKQKEVLDQEDLDLLLTYDPDQILCPIHSPQRETKNLIHLGNKGYNLVLLADEDMPIPPGVILTTEVFRCYPIFQGFNPVYRDFKWQLRDAIRNVEKMTGGSRFGHPDNPLLLSVRSGATISMPGMMSTIINVGSNLETTEGMARKTGNPWFAWDNYRRFVQSWAMSFGMSRDPFTELMKVHKKRYGVRVKREFSGEQMKELAIAYRKVVQDHGQDIIDDPFEQLLVSISLVLASWNSDKAKEYREIMELSDYWGTAVIIQAMAYGNISELAGTGVAFTSNPKRKLARVQLWGDFTTGNQGEDIVSGLVTTYPISEKQKKALGMTSESSLQESFPEIYGRLFDLAKQLIYEKKWNPQELEFTFEGPEEQQLYILQSRDMTTEKRKAVEVFRPTPELDTSYLGRGVGVSGGAMTGKAVFSLEEIEALRAKEPDTPLIFIRTDTVPDDIKGISMSDGLLTGKGGMTSHASIVAFRLEKTCVVGCKQLHVFAHRKLAEINGRTIHSGDYLGISGRNGSIYLGRHPIQSEEETSLV